MVPSRGDKQMDNDAAWQEFNWVPVKLVQNWIMGVRTKHEENGWGSMPGILEDQDTLVFFWNVSGLDEDA